MAKDGTWGNHVVLVAVANTYGTSIRVISSVTDHEDILVTPSYTSSQDTEPLVLGHVFELHYVSLEQKSMSGTTHTVQPSAICLSVSWNIQWPGKKFSIVTRTRFSFGPILAYRLKLIFVVHNYCHICPFFLLNFFYICGANPLNPNEGHVFLVYIVVTKQPRSPWGGKKSEPAVRPHFALALSSLWYWWCSTILGRACEWSFVTERYFTISQLVSLLQCA